MVSPDVTKLLAMKSPRSSGDFKLLQCLEDRFFLHVLDLLMEGLPVASSCVQQF